MCYFNISYTLSDDSLHFSPFAFYVSAPDGDYIAAFLFYCPGQAKGPNRAIKWTLDRVIFYD